jgi:hypothetical protein
MKIENYFVEPKHAATVQELKLALSVSLDLNIDRLPWMMALS